MQALRCAPEAALPIRLPPQPRLAVVALRGQCCRLRTPEVAGLSVLHLAMSAAFASSPAARCWLRQPAVLLPSRAPSSMPPARAVGRPHRRHLQGHAGFCTANGACAQRSRPAGSAWANHSSARATLGKLQVPPPPPLQVPGPGPSQRHRFSSAATGRLGPRKPLASHKRFASTVSATSTFDPSPFRALTFPSNALSSSSPTVRRLRPSNRSNNNLPSALRHCSFRRHAMCRHADADMAGGGGAAPGNHGRELLPANVVPRHYDLTLEPDFDKLTYEGTVVIDVDVVEDSSSIAVNTLELDIHSSKVSAGGQTVSSAPKVTYDEATQVSTFAFDGSLAKGSKAQLEVTFTGTLNDKMAGFYRSTYKRDDGSEGILATTQMEATDARRAFPCFDEPSLKAKFTVTLVADKALTCLSNMDVDAESEVQSKISGGAKKAVRFNTSPLMSTYLLAFIVGELNYVESLDFRVPVRVYAPPGQDIEHGRFALDLAVRTLKFYEKVFGIDFPLPKMDQVAIPDFAAGAMENWGLITYRVVDLLLDEKTSGAATKERLAEVVQHELAHQWFGNLVTMDWWEGLWLNEGFATWASWYSSNAFFPEWRVWETYVTDNLQSALGLDSLRSSHPIEVPVKRADEINQIFDAISYSKGSCILRMISTHIGEDTFLEGVRQYLKKHAYGNTQTGDLWDALSAASGQPIHDIMSTWTKNVGYPVIAVTETEQPGTVHVKQNRFLRTGDVKPEEDKVLYPVFLSVRTKDGVDKSLALNEREKDFKLPDGDFFKINANHTGIYRTSYAPDRLEKLGKAAKDGLLTVEDRTGMIADAGALAASGYQKTSGVLSLLKGFDSESEFVVWNEIISRLGAVDAAWMFEDQKVKDGLEAFLRDLVAPKAHKLGWQFSDSDGHVEQQFKAMMFGSAGLAGDEKVVAAAKEMFSKFAAGDRSAVHPNIRRSVMAIALKYGGKEEYEHVLNYYRSSTSSDERNTCLRVLGRAKDPELIKRTLGLLFGSEVKDQDVYMPVSGLRTHAEGIEALFAYMEENWDNIYKRLPPGLTMLGSMVMIMTSGFTKPEQLARVDKFFADKNTNGYNQSLEQSKDAVRSKISWLQRDREDVAAWLKANGY
ncbi:purine nucleoside permease [Purpureocillium lavendulum]|uniref:Purine nucleoside permease n=1 Tax=Purpureocillium lavendulum TaxID=1247861 RepID=A0AB34FG21_9HYPO|nr:purine nucleoside permease [Purpureocillium lavendulum]